MPFLGQQFYHTLDAAETETLSRGSITIHGTETSGTAYYKSHARIMYNDIKKMLENTNLEIIYDDENFIFNIFGFKFKIVCISSNYNGDDYNIRPYCIYMNGTTTYITSNRYLCDTFYFDTTITSSPSNITDISNANNYYNYGDLLSIIKNYSTRNEVDYTIHLYYNTNFICLQYISTYGAKIPLITLIQGHTPDGANIVYASASCNAKNSSSNQQHYHTLYNASAECYINREYSNLYMGSGTNGFFDMRIHPYKPYLRRLGLASEYKDNSYTGVNKVYLNEFTAFGGIVQFDNVYDVARINQGGDYDSHFDLDSQYTINEENYYCPGDNFRFLSNVNTNYRTILSFSNCHRLLLKI